MEHCQKTLEVELEGEQLINSAFYLLHASQHIPTHPQFTHHQRLFTVACSFISTNAG